MMKTTNKILIASMLVFISSLFSQLSLYAQDYYLDFADPSTYSITCGKINPGQWSVKNDTCELYTPFIRAEVEAGTEVSFTFSVVQSGNGDSFDRGYVYYSIDGGAWTMDTMWRAGASPAVYTLSSSVSLDYMHYVQFFIRMATNDKTEFWAIHDGGIQASDEDETGSDIGIYKDDPGSLPVNLINFSGSVKNGTIELNWFTASESNNDYFVVEKSEDGSIFNDLAIVDGAGNTNNTVRYSFEDVAPSVLSYYRLRQVDFDGAVEFSPIIKVAITESGDQKISMNYSSGVINVMLENSESGQLFIQIFSMNGAKVYEQIRAIDEGCSTNTFPIEFSGNSIYIVSASVNGGLPINSKLHFN